MYEEALECFLKSSEINPMNSEANFNLGLLYQNKSLFEDAIRYFNKTIEINPNYY